ncbi:MAG: class I adenylate-forming enzyme family protein [Emcibacteraceae bacterium]|nr:class I adenylate-forming enzyme family protein [Emcibacteraceae bacterium]
MANYNETLLLGDFLDQKVNDHPDRIVFNSRGVDTTYKELSVAVDTCAKRMIAAGLKKGDGVAVLSPPRTEVFITFFAAARIGLLWMGVNPKYQLREMRHVISDAKPKLFFGIQSLDGRDYNEELVAIRQEFNCIKRFVGFDNDDNYDSDFDHWMNGELTSEERYAEAKTPVNGDVESMLIYTSGSSGTPKGVLLPQKAILKRAIYEWEFFSLKDYPRIMCPLPITHVGGIIVLPLYAMVGGGTTYLMETFDLNEYVGRIKRAEVNALLAVPAMHMLMLRHPDFSLDLLKNIEWLFWSGAKMPDEAVKLFYGAPCKIGSTYGITESCASVTFAREGLDDEEVITNTIGKPYPKGEVRIANDDQVCAVDEEGEIQVRGEFSMTGYLNNQSATEAAFTSDGWYRSGDIGAMRADGNMTFTSRMSEMYVSGGYNVYPLEVEQTLESHPSIAICAVVHVPDEIYGHVGWAYIMAKPGIELSGEDIKVWAKGELANYKVPRQFFIEAMLPMLPIGKIDKVALRAQANKEAKK